MQKSYLKSNCKPKYRRTTRYQLLFLGLLIENPEPLFLMFWKFINELIELKKFHSSSYFLKILSKYEKQHFEKAMGKQLGKSQFLGGHLDHKKAPKLAKTPLPLW